MFALKNFLVFNVKTSFNASLCEIKGLFNLLDSILPKRFSSSLNFVNKQILVFNKSIRHLILLFKMNQNIYIHNC